MIRTIAAAAVVLTLVPLAGCGSNPVEKAWQKCMSVDMDNEFATPRPWAPEGTFYSGVDELKANVTDTMITIVAPPFMGRTMTCYYYPPSDTAKVNWS